jgi:RNA polymerase sigma-70 factor (ECF subfamily)
MRRESENEQTDAQCGFLGSARLPLLLGRLRARDEDALAELFDHYGSLVYSMLRQITRDARLADQALQETFLEVWQAIDSYAPVQHGGFETWLLCRARNIALRLVHARRDAPGRQHEPVRPPPSNRTVQPFEHRRAALLSLLEAMPENQRAVLLRAYFDGLTPEQIAKQRSVPVKIVRALLRRGLAQLRVAVGSDVPLGR